MSRLIGFAICVALLATACGGGEQIQQVAGTLQSPNITTADPGAAAASGRPAPDVLAMTAGAISPESIVGVDPALLYVPPGELRCLASKLDALPDEQRSEILSVPDLFTDATRVTYVNALTECVSAASLGGILQGAVLAGEPAAAAMDPVCAAGLLADRGFMESLYLGLPLGKSALGSTTVAGGVSSCVSFSAMLDNTVDGSLSSDTRACIDTWFAVADRGVKVLDRSLSDEVTRAVMVDCMTAEDAARLGF